MKGTVFTFPYAFGQATGSPIKLTVEGTSFITIETAGDSVRTATMVDARRHQVNAAGTGMPLSSTSLYIKNTAKQRYGRLIICTTSKFS
jgi:hypothetical protein